MKQVIDLCKKILVIEPMDEYFEGLVACWVDERTEKWQMIGSSEYFSGNQA